MVHVLIKRGWFRGNRKFRAHSSISIVSSLVVVSSRRCVVLKPREVSTNQVRWSQAVHHCNLLLLARMAICCNSHIVVSDSPACRRNALKIFFRLDVIGDITTLFHLLFVHINRGASALGKPHAWSLSFHCSCAPHFGEFRFFP